MCVIMRVCMWVRMAEVLRRTVPGLRFWVLYAYLWSDWLLNRLPRGSRDGSEIVWMVLASKGEVEECCFCLCMVQHRINAADVGVNAQLNRVVISSLEDTVGRSIHLTVLLGPSRFRKLGALRHGKEP